MSTCVRCHRPCGPFVSLCAECFRDRRDALLGVAASEPSAQAVAHDQRAYCHPERPIYGRGLCRSCWDGQFRAGVRR